MINVAFVIPVITAVVLISFFRMKVTWWELAGSMVASVAFILIAKAIAIHSLTDDVEYLGGYVTEGRYYEDWNERVSCRHPVYCEECSGSGKDRRCTTKVCGHEHAYDVDYHPEYWTAETTLGRFNISRNKYQKLVRKFHATPQFVDLHRDYHDNDGDMYKGVWKGEDHTLEAVTVSHGYENRPKASTSVFHFERPDTSEIRQYKLFNYPGVVSPYHQRQILGINDSVAEKKLQVLNARLGQPKQLRVYILIFKNQPREAAFMQEKLWEGGNKNEFVICIGIDDQNNVQWCNEFSWTDRQETKVETRAFIEAQKVLNLPAIVDFTYSELATKFVRKNFHDFDYLRIEPTLTQTATVLLIVFLLNACGSYWIVVNDFKNE